MFFKEKINDLSLLIKKICLDKSIDEVSIKELALEIIINIIERVPSIIKNNSSLV
jgi:hypothetical protein